MADYDKLMAALAGKLDLPNSSRLGEPDRKGIEALQAYISNTPGVQHEDLVSKSIDMGYRPRGLIDAATGDMILTGSKANLSDDFEDVSNKIWENNPTPGERLLVDLNETRSPEAKRAKAELYNAKTRKYRKGVAISDNGLPTHTIVKEPHRKKDIEKLISIADTGHEFKHQTQQLTLPDFEMTSNKPFTEGHHAGGIYESNKLIKDVRGISDDTKEYKAASKAAKKLGGVTSQFRKLMSVLGTAGPIGAGVGALAALRSGDVPAAVLHGASAIDPTGISDAALTVKQRMDMNPEEAMEESKEDYYSAMPGDLANEFRVQDKLDKLEPKPQRFKKLKERLK